MVVNPMFASSLTCKYTNGQVVRLRVPVKMNNPLSCPRMCKVIYRFYAKLRSESARVQKETDGVTRWVITMGRQCSAHKVHKAFTVFRQILDLAVMGERLFNSPAG